MGSYHEEGFLQRVYRKLTTLDERQRFYLLLSIFNVMVLFMIVQALRLRQVEIQLQAFQVEVTRLVEVQLTCQQDCKATVLATTFAPLESSATVESPLPMPISSTPIPTSVHTSTLLLPDFLPSLTPSPIPVDE